MSQYLGLKRKTQLKRALFLILDEESLFCGWKNLSQQLRFDLESLKQLAYELQKELNDYYLSSEIELIIDEQHGLCLKKQYGEAPLNIAAVGHDPLFLRIIQEVLAREDWTLEDLCDSFFISPSTAKRKIRLLNQQLAAFDLRITNSTYVRLLGKERHIRSFYTLFSYFSYQNFAFNPYLNEEEKNHYQETIQSIRQVFNQQISCLHKDFLALFFGLHDLRIKSGQHITTILADAPESLLEILPQKPVELSDWSEEDWVFFVIFLFLFNVVTPNPDQLAFLQEKLFVPERTAWQLFFKKQFNLTDDCAFETIQVHLIRIFLFTKLFPNNNYLFHLFPFTNYLSFTQNQPVYNQYFDRFWSLFIDEFPSYSTTYFKMQSFFLMRYLIPRSPRANQINLYLASEFTEFYQSNLQLAIHEYFCHMYDFNWVQQENEAEIIIHTFSFFENIFEKPCLFLPPFMKEADYYLLDARLEQLLVERGDR